MFSGLFAAQLARLRGKLARKARDCTLLIDSTTMRLNQLSATWSRFSDGVHGVKAHIVYDESADCPLHAVITPERVNDITAAKTMPIRPAATDVFDLGYYDYGWWAELDAADCRIVTRLKMNTPLHNIGERLVKPGGPIISDRTGVLPQRQANSRRNPMNKRVPEVCVRTETGKILRPVSNHLTSPPELISDLYKRRWAKQPKVPRAGARGMAAKGIELFFRWVKQTLKIRHFLGTSENAVRIQIIVALIAFLLLRMTREALGAAVTPLRFATLIKASLMHRRSLRDLLGLPEQVPRDPDHRQGLLQWA